MAVSKMAATRTTLRLRNIIQVRCCSATREDYESKTLFNLPSQRLLDDTNLSKCGTWINGEKLVLRATQMQSALAPDSSNDIRAGDFGCSIHPIPHSSQKENQISMFPERIAYPQSEETLTTSSTQITGTYDPSYVPMEAYHYLPERNIVVQENSEVYMAVYKASGEYCIAKVYREKEEEKAYRQFEVVQRLKKEHHIVPYKQMVNTEIGSRIITPYLHATTLSEYLDPSSTQRPDIDLSFMVYKHVTDALAWLKEKGIVHNDVSENTIWLDVWTVGQMLPTHNGRPCCDPQWRLTMSQVIEGLKTAREVVSSLEAMSPGYEQAPFRISLTTKRMAIKRIVDQNGTEAVRLLDFLRVVLCLDPRYRSTEHAIQKVIRKRDLFYIGDDVYCHLRDAEKLLHYLNRNQHVIIFDLTPPFHSKACWYEMTYVASVPIIYHRPTGMVNVTQILNFFDQETVCDLSEHFNPSIQQIVGSPKWEGYYVDGASMRGILHHLHLDPLPEWANASDIKGEKETSTIVATQEMIGNILYHRDDASVRWEGKTMAAETAINICEGHGLWIAHDALRRFYEYSHEPASTWTSICTDADIIGLFDSSNDSDFTASATSHNSFQSNHDRVNPSKKKGPTNIPLLPQQKLRPLEEENTPAKKVEEWIFYEPQRRSQTESTLSHLTDIYDDTSSICEE
ncbi:uncharacterized protein LY89DRAFT_789813 [Mollisia scopiformis]|uniref:Protein kinase domain-containing protein n=1 Tax=Mollisia scopiformis TaxID=149040 RepID=A0A132B4N3_MOLSC|nr:uncharacterized protein LY89DRAFT_789813 [Mollisia scopiformis]KUJ07362.1 hypothetical protein LY89DRAFT_789813 [Mollisia scopiformis]